MGPLGSVGFAGSGFGIGLTYRTPGRERERAGLGLVLKVRTPKPTQKPKTAKFQSSIPKGPKDPIIRHSVLG